MSFFVLMSKISHHEGLYIMTDVQKNHLANPDDMRVLFSAADVAIIPPGTGYMKRRNALNQSRKILRQMRGCVRTVQTHEGERFLHDKSPLREGLSICAGCVYHEGTTRGLVPLPCPENQLARKKRRLIQDLADGKFR